MLGFMETPISHFFNERSDPRTLEAFTRGPLAAHLSAYAQELFEQGYSVSWGRSQLRILWNTVYLQRAIDYLRGQGYEPTPSDLAHLSPLGWEHINLTGDYHWETSPTFGPDQFRPFAPKRLTLP